MPYNRIRADIRKPPLNTMVLFYYSKANREEVGSVSEYEFTESRFIIYQPKYSSRLKSYADYWRPISDEEE